MHFRSIQIARHTTMYVNQRKGRVGRAEDEACLKKDESRTQTANIIDMMMTVYFKEAPAQYPNASSDVWMQHALTHQPSGINMK